MFIAYFFNAKCCNQELKTYFSFSVLVILNVRKTLCCCIWRLFKANVNDVKKMKNSFAIEMMQKLTTTLWKMTNTECYLMNNFKFKLGRTTVGQIWSKYLHVHTTTYFKINFFLWIIVKYWVLSFHQLVRTLRGSVIFDDFWDGPSYPVLT